MFDYGRSLNLEMYRSEKPPEYNLTYVTVPIGVFSSQNDYIAPPKVSFIHFIIMMPQCLALG